MQTPTQRDLARAAGVTVGTVSLALRNHPRIPEKTRLRIQKLAAEKDYHYDAVTSKLAAHLGRKRSKKELLPLGWVHGYAEPHPWRVNPHLKHFWESASERARQLGYRLDEFWLNEPGMTPARMEKILVTRGIEGIIISVWPNRPISLKMPISRFAVVSTNFSIWKPQLHTVYPDLLYNTMLALRQLKRLGYRRIGLALPGGSSFRGAHECESGYEYYAANKLIPQRIPPYVATHYDSAPFIKWFKEHQPDVVIGALSTIDSVWLPQAGVRVPKDVGFVDTNWLPEHTPRAGIDARVDAQAVALVEVLISKILRHELGAIEHPRITLIEGRWVDGPTVRKQLPDKRGKQPGQSRVTKQRR